MKGIVVSELGEPGVLKYTDIDHLLQMKEDQVMIKVSATSVNFADIKMRNGSYPGHIQLPFIPGLEVSGKVEAVGSGVKGLKVGQNVIAFTHAGSYAEYVIANANLTFPIPESLNLLEAAAFPIVSFASFGLLHDMARVQEGESVLIHAGTGGVGTTSIQIAKVFGCENIIVSVGSEHKKAVAKEFGATHVINYNDGDFSKQVLEITDGKGVDVILDSLGGDVFIESMKCLAPFGRLIYYGNATQKRASLDISLLYPSNRSVIGYSLGSYRKTGPDQLKETAKALFPYIEAGQVKTVISKKYSLEEAREAHHWIESRQSIGKVLLIP